MDRLERYVSLMEAARSGSCQQFSGQPLEPGLLEKLLDAARWGRSAENSQPWQLITVRDSGMKRKLRDVYVSGDLDYLFWMEQQRIPELQAESLRVESGERGGLRELEERQQWDSAPVLIVLLGDGRRHWAAPMGDHTFSYRKNQFTDALASAAQMVCLAAASLGLTVRQVGVYLQQPYKDLLRIPDIFFVHSILAVGYPAKRSKAEARWPLSELVHEEIFDPEKLAGNEEIIAQLKRRLG